MRKRSKTRTLTKSEMVIMNHLWDHSSGGVAIRDLLSLYPEPKPAYTTVATFMKVLTQKGFVKSFKRDGDGKTLFFIPTIGRDQYRKQVVSEVKETCFDGSSKDLLSFFVESEELSHEDIIEMRGLIQKIEERFSTPHSSTRQ